MRRPYKGLQSIFLALCLIIAAFSAEVSAEQEYHVMQVPYVSQLYPVRAVVGCEATALLMGLKYKGVAAETGLKPFLDAMPKSKTDPAKGFAGSPYVSSEKIRTTIYPAALAAYANLYGEGMTRDISGADLEEVKREVLSDNPVLIYATMYWKKPYYRNFVIEGQNQWLLRNNHAVLIVGYDGAGRKFYIADPYNKNNVRKPYFYWIEEDRLRPIYDERKWAIAVGIPPQEVHEAPPLTLSEKSFEGEIYKSVDIGERVYLELAEVLKRKKIASAVYSPEFGGYLLRRDDEVVEVNLVNGYLFRKGSVTGKLQQLPVIYEEKVYFAEQDLPAVMELFNRGVSE